MTFCLGDSSFTNLTHHRSIQAVRARRAPRGDAQADPGQVGVPHHHLRGAEPGLRGGAPQAGAGHVAGGVVLPGPESESRGSSDDGGHQARHVPAGRGHAAGEEDPHAQAFSLKGREGAATQIARANGGVLLPIQNGNQHLPKGPHSVIR